MSSQWKRVKQTEYRKWRTELTLTILIFLVLPMNGVESKPTKASWITYPIYITIPMTGSQNIMIKENITDLQCKWNGKPCYVECSSANLTMNISDHLDISQTTKTHGDSNKLTLTLKSSDEFWSTCDVINCIRQGMWKLMDETCNQTSNQKHFKRLLNIKNYCWDVLDDPKTRYFKAEKQCIDAIISMSFDGKSKYYDLGDLGITVVRMDMNSTINGHVQIYAPKVLGYDSPVETWIPMEPFQSVSESQSKVAVVSYISPAVQLFLHGQKNMYLMSQVIRVEVVGRNIKNLSNLLKISFTVNDSSAASANPKVSCLFFDDKVQFQWSKDGSFTDLDHFNSSHIVNCSYDHMTPFAVLLGDLKIDENNWKILSFISYVGSGVSLFFCTVSVFVYTVKRSPNGNYSNSIHLSLSIALLLLNTSYLLSEWIADLDSHGACVFVAVAMEYSLLCCFSWMAVEAIHLYLLLVKVFNTYVRHYMVKLSLFGWGVPAVFVGVSLSVYDILPLYGTKSVILSDTQTESKFCWIIDSNFLYGMNLTCLSLMFLLNTTILLTVICQIIKLQQWDTHHSRLSSGKSICTVLGLTCLLGTTWGLAFFTYGYTNYPVLYLFCICNSLQGLFMFLWICSTTRRTRHQVAEAITPNKLCTTMSTPDKNSFSDITGYSKQN